MPGPSPRPSSVRRRLRWLVGTAVAVALVAALAYPRLGAWYVETRVVPGLARRLGQPVRVRQVEVGWGRAVLRDVHIGDADVVRLARVDVEVGALAALIGRVRLRRVRVRDVSGTLDRAWLSRWREAGPRGGTGGGGASAGADWGVDVEGVRLSLRGLDRRPIELDLDRVTGTARHPHLHGLRLRGRAQRLEIDELTLDRTGTSTGAGAMLRGHGRHVGLGAPQAWRLEADLARPVGQAVLTTQRGDHAHQLTLRWRDGEVRLAGEVAGQGVVVDWPIIDATPASALDLVVRIDARTAMGQRRIEVVTAELEHAGVRVRGAGQVDLPGARGPDGGVRQAAAARLRVEVPAVACQAALAAMPTAWTPALRGYQLAGQLALTADLELDLAQRGQADLRAVAGAVACEVVAEPTPGLRRYARAFTHEALVGTGPRPRFVVGPSNVDFIPLAQVPPYLVRSLIETEDPTFFTHRGFDPAAMRIAALTNLRHGGFRIGASSITMQLIKNLVLGDARTLTRKAQELVLAWRLEQLLSKERILELYLNVIEFAPGVYGVGPAAQHYFGKDAALLSIREAAFFSAIVPRPRLGERARCAGRLDEVTQGRLKRALTLLVSAGHITSDEWRAATAERLALRPGDDCTAAP